MPAAVGAALAGATTEALTNAARHAAPAQVQLRAAVEPDGAVTVLVADDGPGSIPRRCRPPGAGCGSRWSAGCGRCDGDATVSSRPGGGTQVLLRWPGRPDGADDPAAGAALGEVIATRYRRGFDLVVILLVGVWHVGNDLLALLARLERLPLAGRRAAGLARAGGGRRGRRGPALGSGRTGRTGTWLLAGAALAAGAVGIAAVPARPAAQRHRLGLGGDRLVRRAGAAAPAAAGARSRSSRSTRRSRWPCSPTRARWTGSAWPGPRP